MNYKHGRYSRGKKKGLIMHSVEGYKPLENPIYCSTFGCGKVLKPVEALYGNYCFTCAAIINKKERERAKLCKINATYKVNKFHWDAVRNLWQALKTIEISVDQFCNYIHSDDFINDDSRLYYRYDLYVDSANADTIYSYTPNLFD